VESVRCSSLPRLWSCPASVLQAASKGYVFNSSGVEAELGKLIHECCHQFVKTNKFDLSGTAAHYPNVTGGMVSQADTMLAYAESVWIKLVNFFPAPQCEASLSLKDNDCLLVNQSIAYRLTGTLDVYSQIDQHRAILLDWKSGFVDSSYQQQMAGYAYLLWVWMGKPDDVLIKAVAVWLRHGYYNVLSYDAERLKQWAFDLKHNVLSKPNAYQVSEHCRFCPIFSDCEARKLWVNGTLDAFMFNGQNDPTGNLQRYMDVAKEKINGITTENKNDAGLAEIVGDMLFRIKIAAKAVDDAKEMLRMAVQRVGPIPLEEDKALAIREVPIRTLEPEKSFPILRRTLSDAELAETMTISLPKSIAIVRARYAVNADKKRAEGCLLDQLKEANAITIKTTERLETIDYPKEKANGTATTDAPVNNDAGKRSEGDGTGDGQCAVA
jgi:hypothetical protein